MFVGAGQESLVPRDDQMRILCPEFIRAELLLVELAVAEIFHEHVGGRKQPVHGLTVIGLGEIEHHAAFSAVEQREEGGAHATQAAGLVARGRLDLDDLGAQLREDHAAGRAHHHVGHLEDRRALQRQSCSSHHALSCAPLSVTLSLREPPEKYNLTKAAFVASECNSDAWRPCHFVALQQQGTDALCRRSKLSPRPGNRLLRSIFAGAIYNFRSLRLNSCSTGALEGKMTC